MSSTMRTPWPSRSAPHHWMACQIDGCAEGLAGVDGEVAVLALEVLERVEVAGRWVARLGPGDVEAHDAPVAVRDDELGDLARASLVAHRGQQLAHDDRATALGRGRGALLEPLPHRVHDLLQPEALPQVLLRGVAHLGVHHLVRGQVLDALPGHPAQVLGPLHDRDRVVEGLEVALQRPRVAGLDEPPAQRLGVRRRAGRGPTCAAMSTMVAGRRPPSRWSCSSTLGACRARVDTSGGTRVPLGSAMGPSKQTGALPHARVQQSRRAHGGRRRGARADRVAHDHAGPGRPVRRRDRGPPVDPRRPGPGQQEPVRRHDRARLPDVGADPDVRLPAVPPRHDGREAQLRRQQGPLPGPGAGGVQHPLPRDDLRGQRRPRGQADGDPLRHRDRGRRQAGLRRRDRGPAVSPSRRGRAPAAPACAHRRCRCRCRPRARPWPARSAPGRRCAG